MIAWRGLFGDPDTVPAGNVARINVVRRSARLPGLPENVRDDVITWLLAFDGHEKSVTLTLPVICRMRPTSLREGPPASSAQLALWDQPSRSLALASSSSFRRSTPARALQMGRISTRSPVSRTCTSGELPTSE